MTSGIERAEATGSAAMSETTAATDAAPLPFTMVTGDPSAMVCEGDVCFVPGAGGATD
jgi:hypothetical protein